MAFQLSDGTSLPLDVPFSIGDINYPANWLRLSSADEKTAVGIKEVADPTPVDTRFYNSDGSAKEINDINLTYAEDAPDGSYKKGDLKKSVDIYNRSIIDFPTFPQAFNNLGALLKDIGKIQESKLILKKIYSFILIFSSSNPNFLKRM